MRGPSDVGQVKVGPPSPSLAARIGLFDATLVVMGGIVGSGIFVGPAVVAQHVQRPWLILGAWIAGGMVALAGAFIWAELAARMPSVGGQYAYLREAFHPLVGFLYGWALLLVINAGGIAAVAVTFARYFIELTGVPLGEGAVACAALLFFTAVNCLGARAGSAAQSALMVLKIAAIGALVACGAWVAPRDGAASTRPLDVDLRGFGAALVPVLFSYGGWQSANFLGGEIREPRKNLPRALLAGTLGVIALYLLANVVYLRALGPDGLAGKIGRASCRERV